MQQRYGDDFLSCGRVYESYRRHKNEREDINDDSNVGQSKFVIMPESIEKVRNFLIIQTKLLLPFMKMELGLVCWVNVYPIF